MIREISDREVRSEAARVVDLGGRMLMPGLIDCHVHVIATIADLAGTALLPGAVVAFRSAGIMRAMLRRGFTTVRDLGGATRALVQAIEEELRYPRDRSRRHVLRRKDRSLDASLARPLLGKGDADAGGRPAPPTR